MREASNQMPHVVWLSLSPPFMFVLSDISSTNDARLVLGAPNALRDMIFSTRNLGRHQHLFHPLSLSSGTDVHSRIDHWKPVRLRCWSRSVISVVQVSKQMRQLGVMIQFLHNLRQEVSLTAHRHPLGSQVHQHGVAPCGLVVARIAVRECLFADKQLASRNRHGGEESPAPARRLAYLDGRGKGSTVDKRGGQSGLLVHLAERVLARLLLVQSCPDAVHLWLHGPVLRVRPCKCLQLF